jgi:hypothetical protein
MPMVSPGQTLRLPNWRETRTGLASQPLRMENGRRYQGLRDHGLRHQPSPGTPGDVSQARTG